MKELPLLGPLLKLHVSSFHMYLRHETVISIQVKHKPVGNNVSISSATKWKAGTGLLSTHRSSPTATDRGAHGRFDIFPFAGGWMSLTPLCSTLFPTPEQEQHIPHWINISWKSFRRLNVKRETTSEVRLCTDQAHVESFVLLSR